MAVCGAINPESGYFGVAPGTSPKTNKNAYDMIRKDTLFTNVALTANNEPWWEGIGTGAPATDWQGRPYDAKNGPARIRIHASPSAPYTTRPTRRKQRIRAACPSPRSSSVAARREIAPLVYEARNWQHGVLVGASVASETTAAATGAVGVVRRDSMAMKPFCGYNFADYFQHWLNTGAKLKESAEDLPAQLVPPERGRGKFLWPGFGDNLRVLEWMLDRVAGRAGARKPPSATCRARRI